MARNIRFSGGIRMHPVSSPCSVKLRLTIWLTGFVITCVPHLEALQSAPGSQPVQQPTIAAASSSTTAEKPAGPMWWHLVAAHIQDGRDNRGSFRSTNNALDLMIPEGWKVVGQVEWPANKNSRSLKFDVDSPDGLVSLSFLGSESWSWSDDAATRAKWQGTLEKVEPMPPTHAADYLRSVLLPQLRPDAQ